MVVKIVILIVLGLVVLIEGARRVNIQERMAEAKRDLEFGIERSARAMMGLTRGEDLEEKTKVPTARGNQKVKYQETYLGLPVDGASVVMEKDQSGHFTSDVAGNLVENLDDDIYTIEPNLDATEAMRILARKNFDKANSVNFDSAKDAQLEVMLIDSPTDEVKARLVYKLSYSVENEKRLSRPFGVVDAKTGDLLDSWEGLSIHSNERRQSSRVKSNFQINGVGGNKKIGKAEYGGKTYKKLAVTDIGNGTCILKNNVARVYSCNSSWDCKPYTSKPFSFPCDKGYTDAINEAYSPLSDALFFIDATYEMFDEWYNIKNPLQRKGSNESFCSARVHFGTQFQNAFWDGYYITFGDGKDKFYPLTSINVVAHEISHGITEMNSGLLYYGESGGMNEAFSDMAGEVVEYYANKKADWMVGYEIFKKPEGALRFFIDPSEDGRSVGDQNEYCPGMDPHFSSGIFNRAFYLLSVTKGWDLRKAFHPFVVANELYWMPHSTFFEAACGVVQAAKDLEYNADDVVAAFRKVGVEPCVDTRKGLSSMAEITVPAEHTVIYHVKIEEDMDIETLNFQVYGPQITMNLHTPGQCDQCARSGGLRNSIDVCKPSPGLYMLEFSSKKDMVKALVIITGPTTTLMENKSIADSNDTFVKEFSFPDELVKSPLALTMDVEKGFAIALIRYGEKPDVENWKFDMVLWPGAKRYLCKPKKGKYFLELKTWDSSGAHGIDINAINVMQGERIDKSPPKATRPPPTKEEGSGKAD